MKNLLILFSACFFFACEQPASTEQNTAAQEPEYDWSKEVVYAVDLKNPVNREEEKMVPKEFITKLLEDVKSGKLTAYDPADDTKKLQTEEVSKIGSRRDTIIVVNPETGEETTNVVQSYLNPDHIIELRMREMWHYDAEDNTFKKEVIAMAPILAVYDDSGNFMGKLPLYWVKVSGE